MRLGGTPDGHVEEAAVAVLAPVGAYLNLG